MGEYAEMMLDGTCCQSCGELLIFSEDDEPAGYPQFCASCQPDDEAEWYAGDPEPPKKKKEKKVECPLCRKRCAGLAALGQHVLAKHGWTQEKK